MDSLYHRYASPFSFISQMIQFGRFSEFVDEFFQITQEDTKWEYFLHKVFDKSFEEFCESVEPKEKMSKEQIETTVQNSKEMLNTFIPEGRE